MFYLLYFQQTSYRCLLGHHKKHDVITEAENQGRQYPMLKFFAKIFYLAFLSYFIHWIFIRLDANVCFGHQENMMQF